MKKIVLIEDDADLYGLLKYNLEKEGYAMAGSQTGKGAVELCRREKPDLVILDIMLPDTDGREICRLIRSHPELAPVPVIFLTAKGSETDRIVGLELGANDYIVKPFFVREVAFIVVTRPGHHYQSPPGATVYRLDTLALPVSSSDIRARLARGEDVPELPPAVMQYIRARGLYGVHEEDRSH